jgi:acetylornithine deacetylase
LWDHLASVCQPTFQIDVLDCGEGRIAWRARRGSPTVLFNVHLDTVPAGQGWTSDPLTLQVSGDRAVGLGACDIKGAAACLLTLAENSEADLDLLFTTDEEGSNPCAVERFVESCTIPPEWVVVAEPTGSRVVLGHRGYLSMRGSFQGRSGHTSMPKSQRVSAVHRLVDWSAAAMQTVTSIERTHGVDADYCFNLGAITGGIKGNMIADSAEVRWSARPPAGCDVSALRDALIALEPGDVVRWETSFFGPSFPSTIQLREKAQQWMTKRSLPAAHDVDFWTEAALFSQRGWPAVVLGPGDIRQAHAADEWVGIDQLQMTLEHYSRIAHGD